MGTKKGMLSARGHALFPLWQTAPIYGLSR